MTPFTDLPPELFERILAYLKTSDIFACAATCKLLYSAVNASPLLQYQIELEVAGLEDGREPATVINDRLQALRAYQQRWNNLTWSSEVRAKFWDSGNIWDLYGGVFGQGNIGNTRGRAFHFTRLPSTLMGRKEAEYWEFKDINVQKGVRDFSFDPAQDLLVLLDMQSWPLTLHLRTLSTNHPHPDAAKPVFEYMRDSPHHAAVRDESYYLQIMGDLVAVLRLPRGPGRIPVHSLNEFIICNWRTGQLVTTLMTPNVALLTFSFIAPHYFIVGVGDNDGSPDIICMPSGPRIQIYKFDPTSTDGAPPKLVYSLMLPQLSRDHRIGYMLARSDPAPGMPVPPNRPFGLATDDRILVINVMIRKERTWQFNEAINVFVLMSSLLKIVHRVETLKAPVLTIPFERWAHLARVMPSRQEATWVCYVYGTKYVMAIESAEDGDNGLCRACVLDFNPLAARQMKHDMDDLNLEEDGNTDVIMVEDGEDDDGEWEDDDDAIDSTGRWTGHADRWTDGKRAAASVVTGTHQYHSVSFTAPIRSSLPFRRFNSPVQLRCTALMLDEDNIVCVKEDDPRSLSFLTL